MGREWGDDGEVMKPGAHHHPAAAAANALDTHITSHPPTMDPANEACVGNHCFGPPMYIELSAGGSTSGGDIFENIFWGWGWGGGLEGGG